MNILLIILVLMLIGYILINSGNFIEKSYYTIDVGPFEFPHFQKKFYVYNPSIALKDNQIICAARLTDNASVKCKDSTISYTYNKSIEDKLIGLNLMNRGNISSILYFDLSKPEQLDILDIFTSDNLCKDNTFKENGIEDPRLFTFKNELYIYGHYRGNYNGVCKHIPIIYNIDRPSNIIYLSMNNMNNIEKNWMPFEYQNDLYFEYSTNPHVILKCNTITGECIKVYESSATLKNITLAIGGGAPAQKFIHKNIEYFLGISHTRTGLIWKNFFYIFNSTPPFNILKITDTFNILKNTDIEFASGLIIIDNKTVIISEGVDDCYSIIVYFKLDDILKTMKDIN